jgi:hypothetical protein
LLRKNEFLTQSKIFNYVTIDFIHKSLELHKNSLAFTYCQTPIIYKFGSELYIEIFNNDGSIQKLDSLLMDKKTSQQVFGRTGTINHIEVHILESHLK